MREVVPTLMCPSNPGGPWNEAQDPSGSGRYFRTHYCGSAGTRSYPRYNASRPSLFNPHYPAVSNPTGPPALSDGIFTRSRNFGTQDITDGTSQTLLVGERQFYDPVFDESDEVDDEIRDWGWAWFGGEGDIMLSTSAQLNFRMPANFAALSDGVKQQLYDDRINAFGSMHAAGANFAIADGSVRYISQFISPFAYRALGTRAGREIASELE